MKQDRKRSRGFTTSRMVLILFAGAFGLSALFSGANPIWDPHSSALSQDKAAAVELAAATEAQQQETEKLTRSPLADHKFLELNTKAQQTGIVAVIVKLRAAFRPE